MVHLWHLSVSLKAYFPNCMLSTFCSLLAMGWELGKGQSSIEYSVSSAHKWAVLEWNWSSIKTGTPSFWNPALRSSQIMSTPHFVVRNRKYSCVLKQEKTNCNSKAACTVACSACTVIAQRAPTDRLPPLSPTFALPLSAPDKSGSTITLGIKPRKQGVHLLEGGQNMPWIQYERSLKPKWCVVIVHVKFHGLCFI